MNPPKVGAASARAVEAPAPGEPDSATRVLIFSSAAELFAERGYHATHMRDIAEAAGLSKPAVYHYVHSKEELLFGLATGTVRDYLAAVGEAVDSADGDGLTALQAVIRAHLRALLAKRSSIAFALLETRALASEHWKAVSALRDEYAELIRDVLRTGQSQSTLRSDLSEIELSLVLTNLLNGTLLWWSPNSLWWGATRLSTDALADLVFDFYLGGATTSEGAATHTDLRPTPGDFEIEIPVDLQRDMRSASGTWSRILDVAVRLFRREGYLGTTTRDIAHESGLSNATLYHHVKAKEELLFLICLQSITELIDAVAPAVSAVADPLDRLRILVQEQVNVVLAQPERFAVMFMDVRHLSGLRHEQITDLATRYQAMVESVLEAGQRAGRVRSEIEAPTLAQLLLGLVGWTVLWYKPKGPWNAEHIGSVLFEVVRRGVARDSQAFGTLGQQTQT